MFEKKQRSTDMVNGGSAEAIFKKLQDKKVRVQLADYENFHQEPHVVGKIIGFLPDYIIVESLSKWNKETSTQRRIERYIPLGRIIVIEMTEDLDSSGKAVDLKAFYSEKENNGRFDK